MYDWRVPGKEERGKTRMSAFSRMPKHHQDEVLASLLTLEIAAENTRRQIDVRHIKEQYLKLAQKYHPDVLARREIADADEKAFHDKFVQVKTAFDRLVELNDEYEGELLTDPEAELARLAE